MNVAFCARFNELLALRDEDRLSVSDERLLRAHLVACDPCAAEALRHDPTLLFVREAASNPSGVLKAGERDRLVDDVLAAAAAVKSGRRLHRNRFATGLGIAASLFLVASLASAWYARDRGASPVPPSVPVARAAEPRPAPPDALSPLEDVGGGAALVCQFPASAPGEPTVVFLVDRDADI